MVYMIRSEIGPSVTGFVDLIIVFWNRFTGYTGEAHVTPKADPMTQMGFPKIRHFALFL